MKARDIFAQAIEIEDSAALERHLESACGGNRQLLGEVQALLKAHREAGNFLDQPDRSLHFTVSPAVGEQPGDQIGPYTIVRKLGEGGFGDVFLAEQKVPISRQLALKVIKPGLETRKVIARFEAERQVLALLVHPQIARIFDAGTTDRGRPFVAMEFVDGLPLTEYCDVHKLSILERLKLFLSVCRAVQYAHQKGIIHRDLKPSNILVVEENGQPIAKVIDFGIAKATNRQLIETSLATISGEFIGTPQYMSPEQAESGEIDVDTRTDIYSLGVILFELLVGTTPISKECVKAASPSDLSQLVRSAETVRPSKRLDETASETETIVARRRTERSRLLHTLRRDLDWIVLKSLDKERDRRYETVEALARDLNRFLNDQPVEARPPSIAYRFRKLARRYKVALSTAALFVLLILTATIVSTLLAVRAIDAERLANHRLAEIKAANATARAERDHAVDAGKRAEKEAANAKAVSDFVQFDLLANSAPNSFPNQNLRMRDVLDQAAGRVAGRFVDQPQIEASLRAIIGNAYLRLGEYKQAETHLETARDLALKQLGPEHDDVLAIQHSLARLYIGQSRYDEAEALLTKLIALQMKTLGASNSAVLESRIALSGVYVQQQRFDEGDSLIREVREQLGDADGSTDRRSLMALNQLAGSYFLQKRYADAERVDREIHAALQRRFGPRNADTLMAASNLAGALGAQGKNEEAFELASATYGLMREVLGEEHPDTIKCLYALANICIHRKDFQAADEHYQTVITASDQTLGPLHPHTIHFRHAFAASLTARGRFADALPYTRQAARAAQQTFGESDPFSLLCRVMLARIHTRLGHRREAESLWQPLLETTQRYLGKDHRLTKAVETEWSKFQQQGADPH